MAKKTLIFFALLIGANPIQSYGVDTVSISGAVKVTLMVLEPTLNERELPRFIVSITNTSNKVLRALSVENRPDLQDSYCKVVINSLDRKAEMHESISDPGTILDSDYVEIQPNGALKFVLVPEILATDLLPGTYSAYVVYWIDPIDRFSKVYESPKVIFKILEKDK